MSFFKRFLLQIGIGVIGFYLANYFLTEVSIENTKTLFYAGSALGIVNFFVRPVLRLITLPLRILTLGVFTFLINIFILWFVGALFPEITIVGFIGLLYATLIIWILEFVLHVFTKT
jgi:putative membrane protein